MKTIYLDIDDEITSVIDKIRKVPIPEIVLVIPKRAVILQSIVNLKLLKKESDKLRKRISIVTQDPQGKQLITRAGFNYNEGLEGAKKPQIEKEPEVKSPEEAEVKERFKKAIIQRQAVEKARKPIVRQSKIIREERPVESFRKVRSYRDMQKSSLSRGGRLPKIEREEISKKSTLPLLPSAFAKIAIVFLIVCAVVAGIIGYFVLPEAKINIKPKTEPIANDADIAVKKNISINLEKGEISGEVVTLEKEETRSFPATGEKDIGEKATGTVTIYNNYQTTPRTIAPSAFQSADGKTFWSKSSVTVPGYTDTGGGKKVPGQAEVSIEADESGEQYNIGPTIFAITALPADMQDDFYAESSSSMTGGTSKKVKVVSQDDINKAQETMKNDLIEITKQELKAKISNDTEFKEKGMNSEVLKAESNVQADQEADNFNMKVKIKTGILTFKENDAKEAAISKVEKILPGEKYLVTSGTGANISTTFDFSSVDISKGEGILKAHLEGVVTWRINLDELKKNLLGMKEEDAKKYLDSISEIESYNIDFWPFWVKKIPNVEKKLDIKLDFS